MTLKQIRQWAAAVAAICLINVFLPFYGITAYAATARIAFSDPTASVGSEINVKMKITSSDNLSTADIMLAYDANSLEFIEGTNAEGGNGAVRVHGDGGAGNTTTLAYDLKFKASAAGTSKITVTSQEIYDSSSKIVTVDKQGESQVTVSALASASKDATLKSLQVSPGSLTPEFSSDVDSYAVTVGTDVDKLIISADTTDEGASKVVSGNENLQMGENRVTLKVTAQDGETTREYVIVVTKQEGGPNEGTQNVDGEGSFEQFQMTVSRRSFTVMEPDASVQIPEGLTETKITIDGHAVKGWVWGNETEHQYCVIYAMNEAGEKNFYRYDLNNNERTIQRYFEDPNAQGAVSEDVYTQLADQYDSLRKDYSLFRTLLIAAIVVALIFMVLLVVSVAGKKQKTEKRKTSRSGKKSVKENDEAKEELYEDEAEEQEDDLIDEDDDDTEEYEDLDLEDLDESEDGSEAADEEEPEAAQEEPETSEPEETEAVSDEEAKDDIEEIEFEDLDEEADVDENCDMDDNVVYEEPAVPEETSEDKNKDDDDDFEIFDL